VFDMTRTFGHRIFRIKEHIDRFYRSLRYVRIDPGMGPAEMIRLSEEVLERNLHLIGKDDDYWVGQRVTRGVDQVTGETPSETGPTVVIETTPLRRLRRHYRTASDVLGPLRAAGLASPRARFTTIST
jgi:branched-chain amino acid aminotransferase